MSRDALVVGINNYQALRKLNAPADDAEAIAQILEQYGEFDIIHRLPMGITADNKDCVGKNELVTVPKLEKALVGLFKPSGKSAPDLALFFFAGHGLRIERGIEEGYLATSEASSESGNRGLSFQWLRRLLTESPVKTQIILLDCCYSGEVLHFDDADPADRGRARDRLFIAACREYQVAYEEISGQHGVLTRALLNALDPTKHPSGIVHNDTLVNLLRDSWQTGLQSPLIHNSGERFVLTRCAPKTAPIIAPVSETACPYRGLRYFDCNDEDPKFFFGRTALTDQLLDKVRENNFMAVLGASGSGKSSVIRAGLIHQLKLGLRLSGSDTWKILMFRPGEEPLNNLAFAFMDENVSAIDRACQLDKAKELLRKGASGMECLISAMANDNRRVVLLADQFEEVFTLCKDVSKRQQFFECLLSALPKCGRKICLILAMRADFFGKCAEQEYSGLSDYIRNNLVVVKPMNPEELRDAIVKPAKLAGAAVEPELVAEIVRDIKDSPGTLPLMQYALTELWKVRDADTLKLTQYSRMGGVKGTLAKRADEIYDAFSDEEQDIARRIFIELTQLGEGTEDTRRQVRKDALISLPEKEALVNEVIRKLADEKLIVTSEIRAKDEAWQDAVVDVAHEALIRNWTQLRTWLDKSRDDIRFHRRLSAAAEYWEKHGKAEGLLWRSPDLTLLEKFHGKYADSMKPLEREFYKASADAREAAKREKEEIRRRELEQAQLLAEEQQHRASAQTKANRFLWGLIVLLGVLVLGGIFYAVDQKMLTEKSQKLLANNYWFSAVNTKIQGNTLASLHYFALSAKEEPDNANMIENSKFDIHNTIQITLSQNIVYTSMKLTQDKSKILTWSEDGTARLWNAENGSSVGLPMKHDKSVEGAVFSRDGRGILTWSEDGTARLWNADNGDPVGLPMKHDKSVEGAVFSEDDSRILTWSYDGIARLWNSDNGSPIGQSMKHEGVVESAVFFKDERRILTWSKDGTARLWNSENCSPIGQPMKHDKCVNGALFSKDESRILTWSDDGTARLWNAENGSAEAQPMKHEKAVKGAVFFKDERLVLTWSEDDTARLWNAENGSAVGLPMKHSRHNGSPLFSKDELRILTWGYDGAALWNAENGTPVGLPMKHDSLVIGAVFSKDDCRILTWSYDGTARLWNAKNGSPIGQPMKHDRSVKGAVFSKDERRILTWSEDGTARLWNAENGDPVGQPMKNGKSNFEFESAVFFKDDRRILTWSRDGTARLWNVENDTPVGLLLQHDSEVNRAVFSKDERRILTWGEDGTARLWNAENGDPVGLPMKHGKSVNVAVFSKGDSGLLTWSKDGTVRLWNAENGTPVGLPIKFDKSVKGAAFSKDDRRILTWSEDGTVRLWNAENGDPVGQTMKHDSAVNRAEFSKDKRRILTWSKDGTVRLWNAENGDPVGLPMKHKHERSVNGAEFSKDDRRILSWSEDGTARLWNAENGDPVGQPMKHKHDRSVKGAVFSKDDRRILSWSEDGTARLWNAENGDPVGQPMKHKHDSSVKGAVFSKDDRRILSWSEDGTARLWNAENGDPVGLPMEHDFLVQRAVFSKDENRILTWGDDGVARLWNAEDGSSVGQPMKHEIGVNGIMFSKDDRRILTWGDDGIARLWNAENGTPVGQPLKHGGSVRGAVFSKDESRILTWSYNGTARLWNIDADYDFPKEHLPLLVEVCTGTAMDDFGNVRALNKEEWETRKQEYIRISEDHLKTCKHKSANIYLNRQKPFWGN